MNRITSLVFFICLALMITIGCSSGCSSNKPNPTTPEYTNGDLPLALAESSEGASGRVLFGLWNVEFDIEANSAIVTPNRNLDGHYNVTGYVPPEIEVNEYDPITEIIKVYVTLTNPFDFDVYDVRLIIFTDDIGHRLMNPENWIGLYDPPGGLPINPFTAYREDMTDRAFNGLDTETEILWIHLPDGNPNVSFAIDASYPSQCEEPYEILRFRQDVLKDEQGAYTGIEIWVKDHQDDVDSVNLHCPEITGQALVPFTFNRIYLWEMQLENAAGAPAGRYVGYIEAKSTGSGSLALYHEIAIDVHDYVPSHEWARTWGGSRQDIALSVACDNEDNSFVTGFFTDTVDFDPGPGVEERIGPSGDDDIFISKFDSDGNFEWVLTWYDPAEPSTAMGRGIATDSMGNIYVIGTFSGTIDFDPGPEVDEHNSDNGYYFMCKYDTYGNYIWGHNMDMSFGYLWRSLHIKIDNQDNILITGCFWGTTDFDPGPDVVERTSAGRTDVFLSKFDSDGNFFWVQTWGGMESDCGNSIAYDSMGNIFVAGDFKETADFDPGPALDEHTSKGAVDAYLSKFDSSGNFKWARAWGGEGRVYGSAVDTDNKNNVFVGGTFSRCTVDLDPGPGVDKHCSYSSDKVYLSRFDTKGNFIWGKSWGGNPQNRGKVYCMDLLVNSNDIYYLGTFEDTCDFAPGQKIDERTSNGDSDVFMSKFNLNGDLTWVINFGGMDVDKTFGMALCNQSYLSIVGNYKLIVDFDPGNGVDEQRSNGAEDCYLVKLPTDFD